MYKDLAEKTYKRLFFEDLNFLSGALKDLKEMILNNYNLLPDKIQKELFLRELSELINTKKLIPAQETVRIYGDTLKPVGIDELAELHFWLECNYPSNASIEEKDGNGSPQKYWVAKPEVIEVLSSLTSSSEFDFIDPSDKEKFESILLRESIIQKVIWKKTSTLFVYFIEELKKCRCLSKHLLTNSFITDNFLKNDGSEFDNLKQTKYNSSSSKSGKPRNCESVDELIVNLKKHLPS